MEKVRENEELKKKQVVLEEERERLVKENREIKEEMERVNAEHQRLKEMEAEVKKRREARERKEREDWSKKKQHSHLLQQIADLQSQLSIIDSDASSSRVPSSPSEPFFCSSSTANLNPFSFMPDAKPAISYDDLFSQPATGSWR